MSSRRQFLRASAGATLAALAGGEPRQLWASPKIEPKADTMILLWMAGGTRAADVEHAPEAAVAASVLRRP